MNFMMFMVAILAALLLVTAALVIAKLIGPRSFNAQKGEPYECGMLTHGDTWVQLKVGYYLYAVLYLVYDVEAMFLFPWATIAGELGTAALTGVIFFLGILILGLAYAWRKGALEWK